MNLFTLGYEGVSVDLFITRLKHAGVEMVIDVRELPLSRKRGFSKNAFASHLAAAGISYAHVPQLGCPKLIRNQYKTNGDWGQYTKAFLKYLEKQSEILAELARVARKTPSCLVCFEADFNFCHRSLVARSAVRCGAPPVVHLSIKTESSDALLRVAA